ncbi:MAG TPA: nitroreductase family protein [Anaeromyxobacteraceae bacterium]|nr:nitroreductase family protein [Anaeromyxobacteraceae bacterium]
MARVADHPIDSRLLLRWSPRAMSGEPVGPDRLLRLLEAARWAPSGGNGQPWRFAYAVAGTPAFERFFGALAEGNQVWCRRAGALLVLASVTARPDGKPIRSHSLDAGAARMSLALEGSGQGLVVHAMGGFDEARAREAAAVPPAWAVECMIAVGHPGRVEDLPEKLRARESPSGREPVSAFAFEGGFRPAP